MDFETKQLSAEEARRQSDVYNRVSVEADVNLIFSYYVYPAIISGNYSCLARLDRDYERNPLKVNRYISEKVIERFKELGYTIAYAVDSEEKEVYISWKNK